MGESIRFEVVSAGVIYRSESGLQGYYPRVVRLSEDEFLCSFVAGQALETLDSHPMLTRSLDRGATWKVQGPLDADYPGDCVAPYTETGFISKGRAGELFCLSGHWPYEDGKPIIDAMTCGMRRNLMMLRRSLDGGHTWTEAESVPHGVNAPLEVPTGVVALSNGDLMISFSTWKEWNGDCPFGHRVMVIRSSDNGRTWSAPVTVFHDPTGGIGYWEGRIAELQDGRLLTTCWAHDWANDADVPNRFAVSDDLGATWSSPKSMPVSGQTGWTASLGEDLLLFVYNHRKNPVGVRGMIGRVTDLGCSLLFDAPVFEPQVKTASTISSDNYAVTDFQFGAPSVVSLGGNRYLVDYWCVVRGRAGIDWAIIEIKQ